MGSELRRGLPYNAGRVNIASSGDVASFTLKEGCVGFRLFAPNKAAKILFAAATKAQTGVLDGINEETPWTTSEFTSDTGRYETIRQNQTGGWRDILIQEDTEIYFTADANNTIIEITIFE